MQTLEIDSYALPFFVDLLVVLPVVILSAALLRWGGQCPPPRLPRARPEHTDLRGLPAIADAPGSPTGRPRTVACSTERPHTTLPWPFSSTTSLRPITANIAPAICGLWMSSARGYTPMPPRASWAPLPFCAPTIGRSSMPAFAHSTCAGGCAWIAQPTSGRIFMIDAPMWRSGGIT